MTPRKQLSRPERFGLWKAWDGCCAWCAEKVVFKDVQIDHLIPLDVVASDEARKEIVSRYSLPADFDFSGLENLVPSCSRCNRLKSSQVFEPSPALILFISSVRLKAGLARHIANTFIADEKKEKLLAKVEAAVQRGDITESDISELFASLPTLVRKAAVAQPDVYLQIAPGWEVVEQRGHLVTVRASSGRTGITSTSGDASWICSSCGQNGPWNGVICLSCGRMSDPGE
jgi:hypothetical protein